MPSDEDAMENQFLEPLVVCSVQDDPELVDVEIYPPYTTAASFCRVEKAKNDFRMDHLLQRRGK